MADNPDSPSRMRVSMHAVAGGGPGGKFDQIVALGLPALNGALKHHFKEEHYEIDFAADGKYKIRGKFASPVIELYSPFGSTNNRPRPVMKLTFRKKAYFEGPPKGRVDIEGWTVRLPIIFHLQQSSKVPDSVRRNEPSGPYSVKQIVSTFQKDSDGKLKFADGTSFIHECDSGGRNAFETALLKWTEDKKGNGGADSAAYAYAITATAPPSPEASFPPTAVKLDLLGRMTKDQYSTGWTPHDPRHALCFLEQTGGRTMISEDLGGSTFDDLLYGKIGGSLFIAWHIFWQGFIAKRLELVNSITKEHANRFVQSLFPGKLPSWILSNNDEDAKANYWHVNGREMSNSFKGERTHYFELPGTTRTTQVWVTCGTDLRNTLWWEPGREFSLQNQSRQKIQLRVELRGVPSFACRVVVDMEGESSAMTTFTMSSIESSGKLKFEAKQHSQKADASVTKTSEGLVVDIIRGLGYGTLIQIIDGAFGQEEFKQILRRALEDSFKGAASLGPVFAAALDAQAAFVCPGAGSFDMKDPYLNNSGDLMIGLTIRD